jgi:hypothetical protein
MAGFIQKSNTKMEHKAITYFVEIPCWAGSLLVSSKAKE